MLGLLCLVRGIKVLECYIVDGYLLGNDRQPVIASALDIYMVLLLEGIAVGALELNELLSRVGRGLRLEIEDYASVLRLIVEIPLLKIQVVLTWCLHDHFHLLTPCVGVGSEVVVVPHEMQVAVNHVVIVRSLKRLRYCLQTVNGIKWPYKSFTFLIIIYDKSHLTQSPATGPDGDRVNWFV